MLRALAKHRLVASVSGPDGWDRFACWCGRGDALMFGGGDESSSHGRGGDGRGGGGSGSATSFLPGPPDRASPRPHAFPSLECFHALRRLVDLLIPRAAPSRLNQFRAAAEAGAVVSKRLYLVKCEYRAPMRALWESLDGLRAAPRDGLVERYLREYHGVTVAGGKGETDAGAQAGGGEGGAASAGAAAHAANPLSNI